MKKIFTFTLAILATMSLWASETVINLQIPTSAESKKAAQVGTQEAYIGRCGNTYAITDKGMPLLSSSIFAAFKVDAKSTVVLTCFCSAGSNYDKDVYLSVVDWSKITAMATTAVNSTESKTYFETTYKGYKIKYDKATQKDTEYEIELGEVDAGAAAIYLPGSVNSAYFIRKITLKPTCEAPENALVLKASKTVDVVANDEIEFSTEGGNGMDVTIAGKNGETITANKWTAVKGEHIFTAMQELNTSTGKCGNTVELKIVVIGTDPVTEAKITCPDDKAKVGKEVTLTCEAEDATSFQWYKDGEKIEGANAETYSFKPDAAGEFVYSCEAWNKNNDETHPAVKADFKITVADGDCGILATITVESASAAKIEGTFTGTAAVNSLNKDAKSEYEGKTGYKLKSEGSYIGADFTEGTLKAGDKVIVFVTTVSDGKKLQIYDDKDHTNLLVDAENIIQGENTFILGANAEGKKGLYAYHVLGGTEGAQYNAHVAYLQLKRSCGDESKDASLKYLIVNGDTVKAESNVYNYMVAFSTADLKVTVKYEMNDGGATSSGKKEFEIDVPTAPGDTVPATFTVTAEDGATTIEYTINIIRPVTDDSDATIKALEINKTEVKEKDGVFAYEVPADQKIKTVIVEFVLNNPDAKADKASGFEMDVPAAGDPAKETTINVIAKNGTKKEYKIAVTKAEGGEDEGLEGIQSTEYGIQKIVINGQLFILKNGVLYNATGAVVK